MNILNPLRRPFGTSKFSPIRNTRYLGWEDAFEVEFEDGLCFLEPHDAIRKANCIASDDQPVTVVVDPELHSHFVVTYQSGARAEVSWAFIRENVPEMQSATARVADAREE